LPHMLPHMRKAPVAPSRSHLGGASFLQKNRAGWGRGFAKCKWRIHRPKGDGRRSLTTVSKTLAESRANKVSFMRHLSWLSRTARLILLNRRARHRAIRAEHAAIARKGFKPLAAALAVVEELAGVGRHRFGRLIAAPRAGDCGVSDHAGNHIAIGKLRRSICPS
jgi:hypothetical protein